MAVTMLIVMGLLAIFVAGGAFAQEEPATPEVDRVTRNTPVVNNIDNPCTENVTEDIDFRGTYTLMTQRTAEGELRLTHIQADDIVGTDSVTGEQYRLEEVRNISRNPPLAKGELPTDRTDTFTFRVYSLEGNAPLWVEHTTARLTTTPDGDIVVNFTDTSSQCLGEGRV